MLKKFNFKRNYLIVLMLIILSFGNLFFISGQRVWGKNNNNDNNPKKTLAQTDWFENSSAKVEDSLLILENITNSLTEKTNLLTSKVVESINENFIASFQDTAQRRLIKKWITLLIEDVLGVNRWSEVAVTNFPSRPRDGNWMKDALKMIVKNIFITAKAAIAKLQSPTCKFLNDHATEAKIIEFIDSDLISLWGNPSTPPAAPPTP
ncbi:hypothetical protein [Candidatus Phytoplasma solani]|uniref:Uncharacterized protein n=1 Tax=Candidatus Phytoplasma solani TaxID=69896 RepID=A0A421NUU5_9MOLU|nr:hypothetical protein [Candidatus Phytoplasma solani]RMI87798.1 hypothetical protein PSSA1_v1c5670 [Candidatus Phytoplasma solani]